jgi:hypothetical protein
MKSKLIVLVVLSTFLLSSCSNPPAQPEYDEASLINYKACVENWVTGAMTGFAGSHLLAPTYTESAAENCADLLKLNP